MAASYASFERLSLDRLSSSLLFFAASSSADELVCDSFASDGRATKVKAMMRGADTANLLLTTDVDADADGAVLDFRCCIMTVRLNRDQKV
jgi:hypothetical protein